MVDEAAGRQYWIETLGCPKNQVDSEKLSGTIEADGYRPASTVADADLVVVNTCAFIEEARQESIDTILAAEAARRPESELVVTGCMAERYGNELAQAMPEVDKVAPFGVPVSLGTTRHGKSSPPVPSFDLLELPRPKASGTWAYLKIAEGCDRSCGFCAIPNFRGPQRSRRPEQILAEVEALSTNEIVLVAQDLAAYGRDRSSRGNGPQGWPILSLVTEVAKRVEWVRLLYLYPSDLSDELIQVILDTGVPYFDLSLQHVSASLLRAMRRWGNGEVFSERISAIRAADPTATFRSNFIVGYPGETESDHDQLLSFVAETRLDWCGFFPYSAEEGTHGAGLPGKVPASLMQERLDELSALQDRITIERRANAIGERRRILVDGPGIARSVSEAPMIDGVINVADSVPVGGFVEAEIVGSEGPDLYAEVAGHPPVVGGASAEPPVAQ